MAFPQAGGEEQTLQQLFWRSYAAQANIRKERSTKNRSFQGPARRTPDQCRRVAPPDGFFQARRWHVACCAALQLPRPGWPGVLFSKASNLAAIRASGRPVQKRLIDLAGCCAGAKALARRAHRLRQDKCRHDSSRCFAAPPA
jgi:hypothetical protein